MILFKFGKEETFNNSKEFNHINDSCPNGISLSAKMIFKKMDMVMHLELEEEYFLWDNPPIVQSYEYKNGRKGAIVELFGWPYEDIEAECEFISHAGYLGVKVYWPNEHIMSKDILEGSVLNPWWYGTQSVSYILHITFKIRK